VFSCVWASLIEANNGPAARLPIGGRTAVGRNEMIAPIVIIVMIVLSFREEGNGESVRVGRFVVF
jgi:hypothetical protein